MRVLIAGGGIGGLALAAALRGRGIGAGVFERTAEYRACGAALTLWPNGMRALGMIGGRDGALARGWPISASLIRLPSGRVISETPTGAVSRDAGHPTIAIRRADVQATLLELVPREAIRMASPVAAIDEDRFGVRLTFADGFEAEGDVLVGADGLHSRVREHLVPPAEPAALGYTLWRGIVPCDDSDLREGRAFETWAPGVRFGMVQVDADYAYWYAGLDDAEVMADPLPRLREIFGGWHEPIPAVLARLSPEDVLRTVIYDRPALAAWSRGRVALLGDAAHAMTPDLGQGACSAIEDAVMLADALAEEPDHERAFARYEEVRRPWCTRVAARSRRVGLLSQWRSPALCHARNAVTRLVPRPVLHRGLLELVAR